MANNTNLPVVAGGIGAAQAVADLAAQKTIVVTGLVGTIKIEASADGINFAGIFTFTAGVSAKQQTLVVAARSMRVNATAGDATSVEVVAEESLARNGVVPTPPDSGPGASLDITNFGPLSTVFVTNHTGQALQNDGVVNIEVSADGVNWASAFKSFAGGGFDTKTISARFVRAVGSGATADVAIASEESPSQSLTSPATVFLLKPGAVAGGNVYTIPRDVHNAMAAVQGRKTLEYDASLGAITYTDDGLGAYDFLDVILWARQSNAVFTVVALNGVVTTNLRHVTGAVQLQNIHATITPIQDFSLAKRAFIVDGSLAAETRLRSIAGAAPLIKVNVGDTGLFNFQRVRFGNPGGPPVLQVDGTARIDARSVVRFPEDTVSGSGTLRVLLDGPNVQLSRFPSFTGTFIIDFGITNRLRYRINPPPYDDAGVAIPPAAPGTVALVSGDLGRLAGDGVTPQLLPRIADDLGDWTWGSPIKVKNFGPGVLLISPDPADGDTIDGGAGPLSVPIGAEAEFTSDGGPAIGAIQAGNWMVSLSLGDASAAYTPTNVTPDRSYDANATTLDELADVVGTMIADLQARGILG